MTTSRPTDPRWSSVRPLGLILPLLVVLACSDSDSIAPDDFVIVDAWVLTALEGASGNYNSSWTFASNGTYQWSFFSDVLALDLDGSGTYTLTGDVLSVTGLVASTVIGGFSVKDMTLTLTTDSFSFRDDEGDRWTYSRQ